MSESVADESMESVADDAGATPAEPATDFAAQATEFKNRFAGSQRKLTETTTALNATKSELEALRRWKAEKEEADLSEVDKLNKRLREQEQATAAAQSLAERYALAARFPQSFATLGDAMPTDEERLTALEARLTAAAVAPTEESESEPRIDPNNPAKPRQSPPGKMSEVDAWWAELKGGTAGI